MAKTNCSAARVAEVLHYDPETGCLVWRNRPREDFNSQRSKSIYDTRYANRAAGSLSKQTGYLTVRIDGSLFQAHRVAWAAYYGEWPSMHIDHINGVRTDNRISNLRDVPNEINRHNTKSARSDSSTGVQGVGVCSRSGRLYARIRTNGRNKWLGYFDSLDAASAAYFEAKRKLHPGWVAGV